MDRRKELPGGEIGISSNEINIMPNSNRLGIHAINDGLGEGVDFILSGVDAIINAGVDVSLNDGYVFLNGETLQVDAQVVPRTAGTDLYQFLKVTTNPVEGSRNFRDGSTQDVYEENRAIAVNVAVLTDLSVDGDTLQDILKTSIQVQTDYTQTDNTQPDFLKNKPVIVAFLMRGGFVFGNIDGTPTGALSVSGDITSATKSNSSNASTVTFNFANVGTSSYEAIINIKRVSDGRDVKQWLFDSKTSTSMTITISEGSGNVQNLEFSVALIN